MNKDIYKCRFLCVVLSICLCAGILTGCSFVNKKTTESNDNVHKITLDEEAENDVTTVLMDVFSLHSLSNEIYEYLTELFENIQVYDSNFKYFLDIALFNEKSNTAKVYINNINTGIAKLDKNVDAECIEALSDLYDRTVAFYNAVMSDKYSSLSDFKEATENAIKEYNEKLSEFTGTFCDEQKEKFDALSIFYK